MVKHENAPRTRGGGGFAHTNICSVPEKGVSGTEYSFRTVEACFLHRMLPKTRRVPQEAVLRTARIFRTTGGPLWYRMSRMPQMPGKISLFQYSTIGKFLTNARKKRPPTAPQPSPSHREIECQLLRLRLMLATLGARCRHDGRHRVIEAGHIKCLVCAQQAFGQ